MGAAVAGRSSTSVVCPGIRSFELWNEQEPHPLKDHRSCRSTVNLVLPSMAAVANRPRPPLPPLPVPPPPPPPPPPLPLLFSTRTVMETGLLPELPTALAV